MLCYVLFQQPVLHLCVHLTNVRVITVLLMRVITVTFAIYTEVQMIRKEDYLEFFPVSLSQSQ